jgi:hypothetical protein
MSNPQIPTLREVADRSTKEVFVSYAHESSTSAHRIAAILRNFGIRVWIDVGVLQTDTHTTVVSHEIAEAISRATDFVAVVCENSKRKPWIKHETELAAARWLATGRPRIHVALSDAGASLPSIPFTSLTKVFDGNEGAVLRAINTDFKPPETTPTDAQVKETILRLREQFLMGGSTAASALNEFESLWPTLETYITRQALTQSDDEAARWALARLGKLIDARISRSWLTSLGDQLTNRFSASEIDGIVTNNIGIAHLYTGSLRQAQYWFSKSLMICEQLGDKPGVAYAHVNLALVDIERADESGARARIAECRSSARALQGSLEYHRVWLEVDGLCLSHLGMLAMENGKFAEARNLFYEQLLRMELIDSARGKGIALGSIAIANVFAGEPSDSDVDLLQRYLKLSIEFLNPSGAANAMAWLGLANYSAGKRVDGIRLIEQATSLQMLNRESLETRRNHAWLRVLKNYAGLGGAEGDRISIEPPMRQSDRVLFSVANGEIVPNRNTPCHAFLLNVTNSN